MSEKKPVPITLSPRPQLCPICGESTYSSSGIHPQCAVTQADAPRQARLAAFKKAMAKKKTPSTNKKDCPRCHANLPMRRKTCDCGHEFDDK